ncbi:hydrogenase maturation nickel metallochaperone HypA [Brevibacillus massiliensis]|uniref:hydrogenase maturation nickel metallochaperone HypA n=1 Tax=Brevibacillus massiliensis TaxID=1118054 RepID=UPI0003191160|nr:hydrogenase maturation nickel metallochaperone HypA [Brevibacillus massiliensis]
MHEIGLMTEIMSIVHSAAKDAGINSVEKIKVVIGKELMVFPDALQFAFSCLKRQPCTEFTILEIESRHGLEFYVDYLEGD